MAPDRVSVVLVTAPDVEVAARVARALLDERLIACASILPGVRSLYRWEGALHDEAEVLLVLKTRAEVFEALRARLVELHPYQVPEVLGLDVVRGHQPYLDWVLGEVPAPRGEEG
jgi:periplasmic divalent cation tolerance protein